MSGPVTAVVPSVAPNKKHESEIMIEENIQGGAQQQQQSGGADDEGTLNIDEDYTKSLLTPAPPSKLVAMAAAAAQNHSNSAASLVLNENSTSNDETLTMGSSSKAFAATADLNLNLNVELNQLVEELIESVVSGGTDKSKPIEQAAEIHVSDVGEETTNKISDENNEKQQQQQPDASDLDAAVRDVLNALLDQIEARLMENRAVEQQEETTKNDDEKKTSSEFDDLKKQMNDEFENLIREKTVSPASSVKIRLQTGTTANELTIEQGKEIENKKSAQEAASPTSSHSPSTLVETQESRNITKDKERVEATFLNQGKYLTFN